MDLALAATSGRTTAHQLGQTRQRHSLGWLAVVVATSILLVMILGAMADDRWCGPELCSTPVESY